MDEGEGTPLASFCFSGAGRAGLGVKTVWGLVTGRICLYHARLDPPRTGRTPIMAGRKERPRPPPDQSETRVISHQGHCNAHIKTNRAAAKRFRKTASGKYKCGHANRSHILTKKATKRKRNLRQTNHVRAEDAGRLDRMLPYL